MRRPPARRSRAVLATLGVLAVLLAIGLASPLLAKEVPFLSGRLVDEAGMVDAEAAERITADLARLEAETGAQVAVLTVASLEGEVLEDYAHTVFETWGLGRAEADDGVLLLIARDDRKLRIEVGYGLEGVLTDAQAGRVIRDVITPRFKAGDFPGGVESGVAAITGTIRGEPDALPAAAASSSPQISLPARILVGFMFFATVGVFSLLALFGEGCTAWFLYAFLLPFYATMPLLVLGPRAGMVPAILWILGFPIFRLFFRGTKTGKRLAKRSPMLSGMSRWATTAGSRSGGWSSGGSGGGFSGGGGSSGGGGASGGW